MHASLTAKMDVVQDPVHPATSIHRVLNATKVRGASVMPAFRYQNDSLTRARSPCMQGDGCFDCASRSPSGCGQNDSDAHSLATKDDFVPRNRSECCQACPIGTVGPTAETEDNIVVSARVDGAYTETSPFCVFV
jgi:hypothetical protein